MTAPKKAVKKAAPKKATKPVAKKPKACTHVEARYTGDSRDADGKRWQHYSCPTCGQEITQESPDA